MCSAGSMISRTVQLDKPRGTEDYALLPLADQPRRPGIGGMGAQVPAVRWPRVWPKRPSAAASGARSNAWTPARQPSNSQTAGQTLKQNHRIIGDSRRQTHSLLRSENTFGISSPNIMVKSVSGSTTNAMAKTAGSAGDRPSRSEQERLEMLGGPQTADRGGDGRQQRNCQLHGGQAGLHVLLHVQGGLGAGAIFAGQDLQTSNGDGGQGNLVAGEDAVEGHHDHHDDQFDNFHETSPRLAQNLAIGTCPETGCI